MLTEEFNCRIDSFPFPFGALFRQSNPRSTVASGLAHVDNGFITDKRYHKLCATGHFTARQHKKTLLMKIK